MTTYWLLGENKTGTGTTTSVVPEEQLPVLSSCSSSTTTSTTSTSTAATTVNEKKELPVITFTSTIGNDNTKPSISKTHNNLNSTKNNQNRQTK